MTLVSIALQQFRNYQLENFYFNHGVTVIVGHNTAGKTNLIDSIHLLSTGRSFLTEKEEELVRFSEDFARVKGKVEEDFKIEDPKNKERRESNILEVLITSESTNHRAGKRFFVNDTAKRRTEFSSYLPVLLFTPMDLEIISDGPSYRRNFFDQVLEQTDNDYKLSLTQYTKALRQRNALIDKVRETGVRVDREFSYWDEILIRHGQYLHKLRQEFIDYVNKQPKEIIDCFLLYDHSIISEERLEKYREAEIGAGVTLVGPQRDDMLIELRTINDEFRLAKAFGSRGQQRLVVLQLKLLQLKYLKEHLQTAPLLLLDDIFSELDEGHINLVSEMVGGQQTIITTTHEEFINKDILLNARVIELN